ncbi:membrane-associated tyrosine- and threonine-specific cdc2-inhibitory kinase-like [Portunus trituberculatus]|uniref:Membrane-associated tyrosine- and threonine-specific cdc2-inhibitory kinase n=1 Tax=Portunus trituberculatus TaxID=210409 RepID=A0A5B7EIT4_PORTR|nr:membrane-associated tyrosine- and threonine-specific cdc2-inhibitory kinase-like [Portunus trituberculatus]MPC33116.1 Membrane-associated tyrosine- and threonine-specific cdc2-inhibitory kinase [Portunus trituberculatus]
MYSNSGMSVSFHRPAPVFTTEERPLSTKKARGTPRFAAPPRAPVKSCPVTRIFSRINDCDGPQPVSFREDSDTSFIVQSSVYSAKKPELYFEQCYTIEEKLGAGSFGEVYRVRSKEDGSLYACKKTLLRFRGEGDRQRRMKEVQKHEKLAKHNNCVQFYRAWEERQHLYLLTELCRTSLADVAEDRHDLPESIVWEYLVDLLQAVRHLHNHKLVHMDIKPENIFIGFDGLCKLGDFGLVIDLSQGSDHEAVEGDPKYLAPELMNLEFGPPADLFSLGMTILELATDLDLPKHGDAWQKLRQGELPPAAKGVSKELQKLLLGLLHPDPKKRLTADLALSLPAIKRVLIRKGIKDALRKSVMRVKTMMTQTWFFIVFCLFFLVKPITYLWKKTPEDNLNTSKVNSSGINITTDFSDGEDLNDHSLAQPLCDLSSSSSEGSQFLSKPCVNSTPISYGKNYNFMMASPTSRSSPHSSSYDDGSPVLFRKPAPLSRSNHSFRQQMNDSGPLSSSNHDQLSPINTSNETFLITSKNLISLFNAAEFDDDD